jgi:hypothetical protein
MKKIKEINIIFTYIDFHYENIALPFLNWIYIQCGSKDIICIDKTWFYYRGLLSRGMLYALYSGGKNDDKFLYL